MSDLGHEAIHISEVLPIDVSDIQVAEEANRRRAVLVSKDEDFFGLSNRGFLTSPFLWIRCRNMTTQKLWIRLGPLLPIAVQAFAAGEKIVEIR